SSHAPLPPPNNPTLETLAKTTCHGCCYILKDNIHGHQPDHSSRQPAYSRPTRKNLRR
ncbi:unnamed protein product, partial [Brassica rapa]